MRCCWYEFPSMSYVCSDEMIASGDTPTPPCTGSRYEGKKCSFSTIRRKRSSYIGNLGNATQAHCQLTTTEVPAPFSDLPSTISSASGKCRRVRENFSPYRLNTSPNRFRSSIIAPIANIFSMSYQAEERWGDTSKYGPRTQQPFDFETTQKILGGHGRQGKQCVNGFKDGPEHIESHTQLFAATESKIETKRGKRDGSVCSLDAYSE